MTVGISSFNIKQQIPSDIPNHNQYIPPENLQTQEWLNAINDWTMKHKMMINEKKTKTMIFNYTENYQCMTRLKFNNVPIHVINSTRLLGTILSNDLSWDLNTSALVKKANARMELLRKVASFGTGVEDLRTVYIVYIRSLLEQSATVWHSSLAEENRSDLERVQKSAVKVILGNDYTDYQKALSKLDLENLNDRRDILCRNFALKSTKNPRTKKMFPVNEKAHTMKSRKPEKFKVFHANTSRFQNSSIIYMQKLLNENEY